MNTNEIIDFLDKYKKETDKNENKEIYRSYQQPYLDGYAGVIFNALNNQYEVYAYIKNKDKIVSPLLLWQTISKEKANEYYNKLIEIIKSENYISLINSCKQCL